MRTVDVGIDLGTTNSCAAAMVDGEPQVVPNVDLGDNLTPSCVAINPRGELEVGRAALKVLMQDASNAAEGFKRFIGSNETWVFPASGASYRPEQLAALVLQSIRRDLQAFLNEEVDAAVITIPAVFGELERSATLSAAREAGFVYAELVQEPIAAGLAYGWGKTDDERPFLVYDIGGGTFDAAIVQVAHGHLVVRAHRGEHALGGRDIDRAIWEQIVRPQLENRVDPAELDQAERKLLCLLEEAKKRLSRVTETGFPLEGNVIDTLGRPVDDVLRISRNDLDPLIDPVADRTVEVVGDLLVETGLTPADLRGIVLVGGPTRMPRLRSILEEKYGNMLQTKLDPLTVVARGAALHAASVIKRHDVRAEARAPGVQQLRIEFSPVSDQPTVPVGIAGEGSRLPDGSSIRITRSDGMWQTGQIPVEGNRVITRVSLGDDRRSMFRVELLDPSGASVPVEPDGFAIVSGLAAAAPPLSKNIGVSVATTKGATFDRLARRGDPLPLSIRREYRTMKGVRAGDADIALEVVFLEGDSDKPQRCGTIGVIRLSGAMIDRSLPANSEVEVTLKITPNDVLRGTVHIPYLDRTFDEAFKIIAGEVPSPAELKQNLAVEHEVANRLTAAGSALPATLESVDSQIEEDLDRAESGDAEAAVRAGHALSRLGQMLEDMEREAEPKLAVSAMNEAEEWAGKVAAAYGDSEQQALFEELQQQASAARSSQDPGLARQVEEELLELGRTIYWLQPGAWIAKFQELASESRFVDPDAATSLVKEGRTALEMGDSELLRHVVIELWNLAEDSQRESPEARLMWLRRA
jgi:molecular chaperone DnaK